jgi:hypothetical protein
MSIRYFGRFSGDVPSVGEGPRVRLLGIAATASGGALLFAFCERLSAVAPLTSDSANAVLQGQAIAGGNVLLRGWTLSRASFLATDLPFYAVSVALRGASPQAAHDAGAAIYTLLVLSACWLARGQARGRDAMARMAIPLLLLVAAASGAAAHIVLLGPFHVGTALLLVLALIVVDRASDRLLGVAIVWALLTLAVLSDMLAIFVGVVPLTFVCGARLLRRRHPRRPAAALLLAVALALPSAAALAWTVHGLGGFATLPLQGGFARIEDMPRNLTLTAKGTLFVFGVELFAQPLTAATLVTMVRLAGLLLVAAIWWRTIRSLRGDERVDVVTQTLAAGVVVNAAAYLFSNQPADLDSSRYLVPLLVFGAVLAGRRGADWLWRGRFRIPAFAVVLAYAGVLTYAGVAAVSLRAPAAVNEEVAVGDFLEREHLTYGVSGYWNASSVTVVTGGRVRVRAINVNGGTACPFRWEAADAWYDPSVPGNDARFVLRDTSELRWPDGQSTEAVFGPPSRLYRVGRYEVRVWDRNLLNDLTSASRGGLAPCPAHQRPTLGADHVDRV